MSVRVCLRTAFIGHPQTHDLKIPIHTLSADFLLLRQRVESAANEVQASPTTAPAVMARLLADTAALYDSIDTSIKYQVMAINRSQDYVKASSNIPLTPVLETVHLPEVLQMVRKCVDHQQSGRIITIHPPERMCEHIITDHLYVSENLLCLLNNAIKYSDRGAVIDAYIQLINVDNECADSPPMVLVTVADTGIGISDKGEMFLPIKVWYRLTV